MNRITIYDTYDKSHLGWFDLDAATLVLVEDQTFDGNNFVGNVSGLQTSQAELYRTSGGRWVSHADSSREYDGTDSWRFLTDDEARAWIIENGGSDAEAALAEWFPDTPEESGPGPQGGRPAIGPTINVAYPRELLDRIEAAADRDGLSRAAWLRKVAEDAVA